MSHQRTIGRVAVVTGASSGIGRAVARAMLSAGYRVTLVGRREAQLRETAGQSVNAQIAVADVTVSDDVDRVFNQTVGTWGRVDILFNNAGVPGPAAAIDEIDLCDWNAVVAVNLTAAMMCARAAMRIMKSQSPRGGRIINNGSISAHTPRPQSAAYSATKHAISGLTKSIDLDGRAFGILCGQIDIGNAATEIVARLATGSGALQPDGSRMQEPTMPAEEAARAVLFMADMPTSTNIPSMTIMAATMPFTGRG